MYTTLRSGTKGGAGEAVILLVPKAAARGAGGDGPPEKALGEAYEAARARPELTDTPGEWVDFEHGGRRILALAIGETEKNGLEHVRVAAGKLAAPLHARRIKSADLVVPPALTRRVDAEAVGVAFAEGVGLASFRFEQFKQVEHPQPRTLTVRSADGAVRRGLDAGIGLAESVNFARRLDATPPNIATPDYIAQQARRLAGERGSGLKCTVFRGEALKRNRFVGLINVGKGSEHKPCMIQLVYRSRRRKAPTVVLVGKTLTFDSGGLSLKVGNGMRYMKYDKSGGMAVLGAMHALRGRELGCHVVGLLPAAENAISHEAYRVDDILAYPNGVSVEVTNTDAEGRLVLADALAYACRKFDPAAVIDLATLTGGIVTALGEEMAGLFAADDRLRERVEAAAERAGEAVWPMPITQGHRDALESNHADIVNSTLRPAGSPCVAAAFLERFVDRPEKWAHLDIAGPAATDKPHPIFAPGPTGFGTRLLIHLLEGW